MAPRLDERTVLTVQGGYYIVTGAAPFVSRRAFEAVTGPKTEWWLVETVGAIVTTVGAALLSGAPLRADHPQSSGPCRRVRVRLGRGRHRLRGTEANRADLSARRGGADRRAHGAGG
jgi:hypothetical protein